MWLNDKTEEHLREMASFRSCQIIITDFCVEGIDI